MGGYREHRLKKKWFDSELINHDKPANLFMAASFAQLRRGSKSGAFGCRCRIPEMFPIYFDDLEIILIITKASLLAGVCFPLGMYWGQSF